MTASISTERAWAIAADDAMKRRAESNKPWPKPMAKTQPAHYKRMMAELDAMGGLSRESDPVPTKEEIVQAITDCVMNLYNTRSKGQ